ncbi:MAG: Swt1 family HEPN domain-containing protein [Acidobacteriota bacterium]
MKSSRTLEEHIKLFAISNQLLENDLDRIEREHVVDLGRNHQRVLAQDQDYYPQIDREIRQEAERMGDNYEIFYSLERTIRSFVSDTLEVAQPGTWWSSGRVPQKIRADAEARMQKEIDAGVTPRSDEPLDFTNFGELGELIKTNWDVFGGVFKSTRAVENVMSRLNTLRGPIAHCCPLSEDEIVRLRLSVRDWFRLME